MAYINKKGEIDLDKDDYAIRELIWKIKLKEAKEQHNQGEGEQK